MDKDQAKKLKYARKNFWEEAGEEERKNAFDFNRGYKEFLNYCKTTRETVLFAENVLRENGFKDIYNSKSAKKVFGVSREKNIIAVRFGKKKVSEGLNIVAAHVDTPHIDLKQCPVYEDGASGFGMLRTHYYGGIKKYQWLSTPLALHGVVIKADGEKVRISVGEDDGDPVFVMPDLLPHLASKEQYAKKMADAVDASRLNVVFNSIPFMTEEDEDDIKEAVKLQALVLLNEKYGITEEDLISAELELVPAGKARDCGLDGSLVLAYGQDDRVCSYTSLTALLDAQDPDHTAMVYLVDKEEIGNVGNTGADSIYLLDFISDLLAYAGENGDSVTLRKTLINSRFLSADVNAAINPNFPNVLEHDNAIHLGNGVGMAKYTGARGKSGTNDANAEFVAQINRLFNQEKVFWQTGELGKVDEGGGGTIARKLADYGSDVLDCGPGVLGMHALYELTSKADVYSTYRAYKVFYEKA